MTQLSPSKVPLLMSYEERMEKNRLAKEATRLERIAAEKQRLIQIMADQAKEREWKQTVLFHDQALQDNAARRLQTWLHHIMFKRRYHAKRRRNAAAVVAPVTHVAPAVPTLDSVEGISISFRQLRERIVQAARVQFGGGNHSNMTFASLRTALIKLFATFDPHGSGDVSLADFKAVVESQLHVTIDSHWDYVRECFDVDGSGSLNIAEFVAFAFADSSVDEMGVLGYQLRDAILHRVKAARKEAAATIEDAVRYVFRPVFHKRDEATFADFSHSLAQLKLGFTLGQLSRLVLRLDQDKNHLISLDELLRWLKLRSASDNSINLLARTPSSTTDSTSSTRASVSATSVGVKELRQQLVGLAGEATPQAIKVLFEKMDANQSSKLSATELHRYLAVPSLPLSVVESAVACMDVRRSSVVSKADFIAFCLDTTSATEEETGVVMEQCRRKLTEVCVDQEGFQRWFGAMSQQHGKVRTTELKHALKTMIHVPDHVMEGVVRRLDFDGSGWISEKEFQAWVQPVRDIEVLLQLVEQNQAMQQKGKDLFSTFDLDGNGVIGLEEFHAGLIRFQVHVNKDEAAALLKEFDVDTDGVLNASELNAIVEAYNSDDFDLHELAGQVSYQGTAYDDEEFDD
ncbi:hypothetical protein DYB32_000252 [Aphanomyces invadans]|uniref:EF-hand domain-containing protein n=1 Tax=Aphanomyces invadans TaxID=157072 RepID=A0A3R6WUA3_9STRA|nr:hypothetical protein DYB32_000252 [Aphanomyces invadans]